MDPLISVVMAVRNGERFVADAVESVLTQTLADLELLVVDDASTDSTAAILVDQASRDPRVTVLHRTSPGVSAARNLAIAHARGDLIAFLDADDIWLPDKLARQHELFAQRPELAVAFTGYFLTDQSLYAHGIAHCIDLRAWLLLDGDGPGLPSTAMFRRSALADEARFDESLSISADLEFACRAARCGPLVTVEEPLAMYRTHRWQMSTDLETWRRNMTALYAMLAAEGRLTRPLHRVGLANLNVRLLVAAIRRGRFVTASKHLWAALRLSPTRLIVLPVHAVRRRLRRHARWLAWSRQHGTSEAPAAGAGAGEALLVPVDLAAHV